VRGKPFGIGEAATDAFQRLPARQPYWWVDGGVKLSQDATEVGTVRGWACAGNELPQRREMLANLNWLLDARKEPHRRQVVLRHPAGHADDLRSAAAHGGRAGDAYHDRSARQAEDRVVGELDELRAGWIEPGPFTHCGQHSSELGTGKATIE